MRPSHFAELLVYDITGAYDGLYKVGLGTAWPFLFMLIGFTLL